MSHSPERTLLLVDDDEKVLRALDRLLRKDGYRILTAPEGQMALDLLVRESVGVILSSHRLPGMSGVELLRRSRDVSPDAVRLILAGNADLTAAMEAVNRGAVYRFLVKPWDDEAIRVNVSEAFQYHELLREKQRLWAEIEGANRDLRQVNRGLAATLQQKERELAFAYHHDPLTGLPNRFLLLDRLALAISEARRSGLGVGVVMLDLDRFKVVNETLGHSAGDQLIRLVAERFTADLRRADTVARLTGDEFCVILPGCRDSRALSEGANRVLSLFAEPFDLQGNAVYVAASVGISAFPGDGAEAELLLGNADAALHRAKQQGGNGFQFYCQEMNARAFERLVMETNLRKALEKDEFCLYYQAQMDLITGRVAGFEALLRWRHPTLGLVSPGEFVPLLEETGLIVPVGHWILQTVCRQIRAWQDRGFPQVRVAANLSPRQFVGEDLVQTITRIAGEAGVDPSSGCLEVEITESGVMKDPETAAATLVQLKGMGVGIAVDDFGTGYSSLSYLRRFPIGKIKIDRSFVRDVPGSAEAESMVSAIVAMAHSLRLEPVAEGVETCDQLAFLRSLGCGLVQGYLFSRPVPADEAGVLLESPPTVHS